MNLKKILKNLFQIDGIYRCKIGDDSYLVKGHSSVEIQNYERVTNKIEQTIERMLEDNDERLLDIFDKQITIRDNSNIYYRKFVYEIIIKAVNRLASHISNQESPIVIRSRNIPGKLFKISMAELKNKLPDYDKNMFKIAFTYDGYIYAKMENDEDVLMLRMVSKTMDIISPRYDFICEKIIPMLGNIVGVETIKHLFGDGYCNSEYMAVES